MQVKGRTRHYVTKEKQHVQIQTSTRFSVLQTEGESEKEEVRCLVIGDSRVRPLGRVFCDKKDRCAVKPGAIISEIGPAIQEELAMCDPEIIIVQVGVNEIGPRRSVKVLKDYTELLLRLKEARKPVIVTGILPRAAAKGEWYSRALSANASVARLCSTMGLHFVDLWDEFYGRRDYYLRDGLHLSNKGASALGDAYRYVIQEN